MRGSLQATNEAIEWLGPGSSSTSAAHSPTLFSFDAADDSRRRWAKAPSIPNEPAIGVLDAVFALTGDLGAVERFVVFRPELGMRYVGQ